MANETAHVAVANRNQETINHLCADLPAHSPWIVTVAAYKAIHIIEAVFAAEPGRCHTSDHGDRFRALKAPRYRHIYKHFAPLYRASRIARYLEDEDSHVACFDDYMPPERVPGEFLFHRLKQIENSARGHLKDADALRSIEEARPVVES